LKLGRFGLEPAGPVHHSARPLPVLEVAFSWAKAERTEWAVAKLVELGLDVLTPLVADRTVVRPDRDGATRREARLAKIVREAAMQSRRPFLTQIGTSQTVDAIAARAAASQIALAEPGGGPISLATPVVLVGPEGGWSERELSLIDNKVSLGDGVLRVETAALAAGTLLTALRSEVLAPAR
jgi:16S rRNA (uracil1498-N3)-methyltransferase